MSQQPFARPPYLDWGLDRWKIGVAVVLFLLLALFRPQPPAPGPEATSPLATPTPVGAMLVPSPTVATGEAAPPGPPTPIPTVGPPATPGPTPKPAPDRGVTLEILGQNARPLPINTPFLFGETVPFGRVQLWIGERKIFLTADEEGRWQFPVPWSLPVGMTWVRARLVDEENRPLSGFVSRMAIVGPRATPLTPPTFTPPLFDEPFRTSTPVFSGEAPPGVRLFLYARRLPDDPAQLLGETAADPASGRWHWMPETPLAPGPYEVWMVITDADGRPLTQSERLRFVIAEDATPHQPPRVEPELAPTPATPLPSGEGPMITALIGVAAGNARLFVYVDGVQVGETRSGADGSWRFDFPAPVPGSGRDIRVVEVDEAGRPLAISAPPFLPITGGDAGP